MSLFSINKANDNRKNPRPNENDQVLNRLAHGTTQFHNKTESDATTGSLSVLERQILAKQDGTNKAIFGFLDINNRFGIKVAPDGTDVLTATDNQLIFNSEQNVPKFIRPPEITNVSFSGLSKSAVGVYTSGNTTQIAHGLDHVPIVIADAFFTDFYTPLPGVVGNAVSGSGAYLAEVEVHWTVDSFYVYFTALCRLWIMVAGVATMPAFDIPIKYYLLQESAAI